jgi:alkanesulfonate monooxygenase SsuD/methylene tetrahydromethanopterin reductase-like flavin-dependent oxidoreductase (luciferase family)
MEIGVGLPSTIPGASPEQLRDWARRAEALGFSSLGVLDRIVYPGYEPLTALAAAAAVTSRIRLATLILIAPCRANGALVAKQAATLDAVSGGRLVLGVAVGWREDDYVVSGVDFRARGRSLDDMLALWARIWDGEPFGTAGAIGPRARPELILGGMVDAAFTRAARYGDGWTGGGCTPEILAQGKARLQAAWAAAGRAGAPRALAQPYYALGPGAAGAAAGYLRHYYGQLGAGADAIVAGALTDAASVRRAVDAYAAAGCDELVCFPCSADPVQVELLAQAIG